MGRNNEIVLPYEGIDGKMKGFYIGNGKKLFAVGFSRFAGEYQWQNTLIDGQIVVEVSNLKDFYVILNGIMFGYIQMIKWILDN